MTDYIEKTISNLIESDFPDIFREEGPVFVEFVKKYYEWMESSNNVIYHSRRLLEYGDVDDTVDDFIVYFKEKYLKNIQFNTRTNTRQLIKHTLDLYRSKGTERAVSLLFALVFGESAEVYYPAEDLFKLSDGSWVRPTYLEVTDTAINEEFVGKQVTGLTSGATGFVERLVRRKIRSKYIEVFYISAVRGSFQTNERITYDGANVKQCPFVVGSTTTLDIIDGGTGFSVGDIVTLVSDNGVQGKGLVREVETVTGLVDFELIDGGWGYTANAEIIIAEKVLNLSNAQVFHANAAESDLPYQPFVRFETITQPMAQIQYNGANGTFVVNDIIETYNGGGTVTGRGRIITISANSTAGTLVASTLTGNLASNTYFYKQGNTIVANTVASGYTDMTATANLFAWSSNVQIISSNLVNGPFVTGETIYQLGLGSEITATATANVFVTSVGSNGTLYIENANGVFKSNTLLYGETSGASATVRGFNITVGVKDISNNDFSASGNNYFYTSITGANGTISRISSGTGANYGISNTLTYTETVRVDLDFLRDFLTVELDAAAYGLSGNATANLGSVIIDSLGTANVTMGTITALSAENPGTGYDTNMFSIIYEPYTAGYDRHDYVLEYANTVSTFYEGEVITQSVTGAQAIILPGFTTSTLYLKRVGFNNTFNNTDIITGETSGATATIVNLYENRFTTQIGLNANVTSNVVSGNGVVSSMDVYDSGYGYLEDEVVDFLSSDELRAGRVRISLGRQGRSEGYYRSKGSFLSDNKYLHDGYYYQEYSYDVKSSVALNNYEKMLKQVIHVAGTMLFGTFVKRSLANTEISLISSSVTQS